MREEATIVHRWRIGERVYLEADGNVIEIVIEIPGSTAIRAVITDAESGVRGLREARSWNAAVYPPASPGRRDLVYPPPMRARAWDALSVAGEDRPNEVKVSEFLHAWQLQQDSGNPERMEEYAVTWRKLRYAC